MRRYQPYILMLEHDPDDRRITEAAAARLGYDIRFKFLTYSTDLFTQPFSSEKPALIMLEYKTTPDDIFGTIKKIKEQKEYEGVPIIILSEVSTPSHIKKCYSEGVSTFITKPSTIEQTIKKIDTFFKYWLEVAELQ